MPDLSELSGQNARAWDEIAQVRALRFPPADFFAGGGSTLVDRDLEAVGPVRDATLLHLQCATGEDTLSWAVQGARAVGVDISVEQIRLAGEKAQAAGLDVRFVTADVLDLPADLQAGEFDVVYTGGGSLVWLADIDRWAGSVARALRRGGRLVVHEEHPIAWCLESDGDGIRVTADYFQRSRIEVGPPGWGHFDAGGLGTEPKFEFVFPLGDVITALVRAGLRVVRLEEFPGDENYRFGGELEQVSRLPGSYVLVAVRDE